MKTKWKVGHLFRWSEVAKQWLQSGHITIKDGETVSQAYFRAFKRPIGKSKIVIRIEE